MENVIFAQRKRNLLIAFEIVKNLDFGTNLSKIVKFKEKLTKLLILGPNGERYRYRFSS